MNVVTFIGIFKKVMSDAKFRSKISDQHLALIFYLPWICITALQNWGYRCGHELSDGYFSTRLVYFSFRTLMSIPLMCPLECAFGEFICSCIVTSQTVTMATVSDIASPASRLGLVGLEMFFLCLVGLGASASAQSLVAWSLTNAKRAEEAMSALAAARQDLLDKLCDAEVELSGQFALLDPAPQFLGILGHRIAEELKDKSFMDIVAADQRERAAEFFNNVNKEGATKCVHLTLQGLHANSCQVDVRAYHAAQTGRSNVCKHRLALIVLSFQEPTQVSQNASSDNRSGSEPAWKPARSPSKVSPLGGPGAVQERDDETDTLLCSESLFTESVFGGQSASAVPSRKTKVRSHCAVQTELMYPPHSSVPLLRCSQGTQTESSELAKKRGDRSEPRVERTEPRLVEPESGIRPLGGRQRPPLMPKKVRAPRPVCHFSGLAVRGRKVVHSDTCRLCLMEIAKKLNVAGSACCSFHLVIGFILKQGKIMLKNSPCRAFEFYQDWQCSVCHLLHSFDDAEEEDGKYWCDVCGSTEAPAETEPESLSRPESFSEKSHESSDT